MDFRAINNFLHDLQASQSPSATSKIDTMRHPFIQFKEKFRWPSLSLDVRVGSQSALEELLTILIAKIPDFLKNAHLLPAPHPRKEDNYLHFVRRHTVSGRDYLLIIKIAATYLGGAVTGEIATEPQQGFSPSFESDRIYYKARLVPVTKIIYDEMQIVDFEPRKLDQAIFYVSREREQYRQDFASLLFDEIDFTSIEKKFHDNILPPETKATAVAKFHHFCVEYLAFCLVIHYPQVGSLQGLLPHFDFLSELLKNEQPLGSLPDSEKEFWHNYFRGWAFKPCYSRAGNPQWQIENIPVIEGHTGVTVD